VGVYGIVALVVRMDDFGFSLIRKSNNKGVLNTIGLSLVKALPVFIKTFSVVGTIALLLVSGGIFSHNIDFMHHVLPTWPSIVREFMFGAIGGVLTLALISAVQTIISKFK
jgi:predicted DNA repair protein MutK